MLRSITSYLRDRDGGSAAEYALILAIIAGAIAAACFVLGGSISKAVANEANCMNNASSGC
jgi:Flp pilus assembly pilin Flp